MFDTYHGRKNYLKIVMALTLSCITTASALSAEMDPGLVHWGFTVPQYKACGTFDDHCVHRFLYDYVAQKKTFQQNDPALPLLAHAANLLIERQLQQGKTSLSPEESEAVSHVFNGIIKTYGEMRQKAEDSAHAPDSLGSHMDMMRRAVKSMSGENQAKEIGNFLLDVLKEESAKSEQSEAQQEMASRMQELSKEDPFGTFYDDCVRFPALTKPFEVVASTYLGFGTDDLSTLLNQSVDVRGLMLNEYEVDLLGTLAQQGESGFDKLNETITKLNSRMNDFQVMLQSDLNDAELKARLQDATTLDHQKKQAELDNYAAVMDVAASLLKIIPNPEAQRNLQIALGMGKIGYAIFEAVLNPKSASNLVLGANIFGAATSFFALFQDQQNLSLEILKQIQELQHEVAQLSSTICDGFNMTFQRLDEIFKTIHSGFKEIIENQQITQQTLVLVAEHLNDLRSGLLFFQDSVESKVSALAQRNEDVAKIDCWPNKYFTSALKFSLEIYEHCLRLTFEEGIDFSRDSISTNITASELPRLARKDPDLLKSGSPFSLLNFSTTLDHHLASESINFLAANAMMHLSATPFEINESSIEPLAEPSVWVAATKNFFDLYDHRPPEAGKIDFATLNNLFSLGNSTRKAILEWRSPKFAENIISALDTSTEILVNDTQALIDKYRDNKGLDTFDLVGTTPTETKKPYPLPEKINAGKLNLDKDFPIGSLPLDALPAWAKVGDQIGAFKIETEFFYNGLKDASGNHWSKLEYVPDQPPPKNWANWTVTGKVKARFSLVLAFKINDDLVSVCHWDTKDDLLIGNYTTQNAHTLDGFEESMVSYSVRSNADILTHIWNDGNYQLRDRLECSAIQEQGEEKHHIAYGRYWPMVEKKWSELRGSLLSEVIASYKNPVMGEEQSESTKLWEDSQKRKSVMALVNSLESLAYDSELSRKSDLFEVLYGQSHAWLEEEFTSQFSASFGKHETTKNLLTKEKVGREKFDQILRHTSQKWIGNNAIYPEWDSLMSKLIEIKK